MVQSSGPVQWSSPGNRDCRKSVQLLQTAFSHIDVTKTSVNCISSGTVNFNTFARSTQLGHKPHCSTSKVQFSLLSSTCNTETVSLHNYICGVGLSRVDLQRCVKFTVLHVPIMVIIVYTVSLARQTTYSQCYSRGLTVWLTA